MTDAAGILLMANIAVQIVVLAALLSLYCKARRRLAQIAAICDCVGAKLAELDSRLRVVKDYARS